MNNQSSTVHHWATTYTGRRFWPTKPRLEDIVIEDIAHALSMVCRFGGHTREFYSVAQHSVLVSMLAEDLAVATYGPSEETYLAAAFEGLMHDAPEAYCGDVVLPLKIMLPQYQPIELGIWLAVKKRFGMTTDYSETVKHADRILLMTERRDLTTPSGYSWSPAFEAIQPLADHIQPMNPAMAERYFMVRFNDLMERMKLCNKK